VSKEGRREGGRRREKEGEGGRWRYMEGNKTTNTSRNERVVSKTLERRGERDREERRREKGRWRVQYN
jgi:hypothetical protein